ncbi:MAG: DNA-3-methyladenine glycosylase [Candidatus Omnitrophota bacterium]|nr:DNA-3-methyladenine glycosylase [Candidatus Omnitrophota bacterium]
MISELNKRKRNERFFQRPPEYVAQNLLGDFLVVKDKKKILIGKIVETESYLGLDDDASHSFGGKITARNKIMYHAGGIIYVYLIYGKFYCFNIVVSKKDVPQAVFIRALEPIEGIDVMKRNRGGGEDLKKLTAGPCRWTQAFGINKQFLGKSICSRDFFVARGPLKKFNIVKTKRVGVEYAAKSKDLPLRFYIKDSRFVSRKYY